MFRKFFTVITVLVIFGIAVPEIPTVHQLVGVEEAQAQTKKKRKSLFQLLFKRSKKIRKKKRLRLKPLLGLKKRKKKTRTVNAATPKVVVTKQENALKILVVGDFIATGLASGLTKLYESNPNIVIVSSTNASSGLVRDDVVNWPEKVPQLIEELKPIAVVSLVGMNDRQQMRLATGRVNKLSEPWAAAYNARIETITKAVREKNIPLVWVGLPPVRSNAMNTDYLVFNEFSRNKTEAVNGTYVDVWDGFTNAEGKFVSAGPDIKGQIVRLRGGKGINMTRAGKDKLAFYADKALRKLGLVTNPTEFLLSSIGEYDSGVVQPTRPEYDPAKSGKTIIIPLGAPASDGGDVLEGETGFLEDKNSEKSVSYQLVEKGLGFKPKTGRIDSVWGEANDNPKPVEKTGEDKAEKTSGLKLPTTTLAN